MNAARFHAITSRYPALRVAVVGDFFLDRYLHIDPARDEVSIETGLTVYNVVEVRPQPGAAGTIVNNLVALGIGEIHAVGFCGDDGEGYELRRALAARPGVTWTTSSPRRAAHAGVLQADGDRAGPSAPRTEPARLQELDADARGPPAATWPTGSSSWPAGFDALLLLDQVDRPETGVVTAPVKAGGPRRRWRTTPAWSSWPTAAAAWGTSRRSASR